MVGQPDGDCSRIHCHPPTIAAPLPAPHARHLPYGWRRRWLPPIIGPGIMGRRSLNRRLYTYTYLRTTNCPSTDDSLRIQTQQVRHIAHVT